MFPKISLPPFWITCTHFRSNLHHLSPPKKGSSQQFTTKYPLPKQKTHSPVPRASFHSSHTSPWLNPSTNSTRACSNFLLRTANLGSVGLVSGLPRSTSAAMLRRASRTPTLPAGLPRPPGDCGKGGKDGCGFRGHGRDMAWWMWKKWLGSGWLGWSLFLVGSLVVLDFCRWQFCNLPETFNACITFCLLALCFQKPSQNFGAL